MSEPSITAVAKRPSHKWLATMDALIGIVCVSIISVLIYLTQHPKVVTDQRVQGVSGGIGTAVLVFSVPAILYLLCSIGLFLRWRWAWWVSLILNTFFAVVICQDVIVDWHLADSEDVWLAAIVAVAALLHVVEPAWRWLRHRRVREIAEPATSR